MTNPLDRDGFVKVYRRVMGEIYGRLRRRRAADTMTTYTLLVLEADHLADTMGFVKGSQRAIAAKLGIPRQTFFNHTKALAKAGELEIVEAVNQHQDGAGIKVIRYREIIGAVPDRGKHAVPDRGQHRLKSRPADHDLPAETYPEEVKKLGTPRTERMEEAEGRRPPSPFDPDGRPQEKAMLAAVAEALGHDADRITRTYRGSWTTVVRDLIGQGVVPAEVPFRVEAFKGIHGRACRTPSDLNKYWGTLRSEKADRAHAIHESLVADGWEDDVDETVVEAIATNQDKQLARDGIVSRQEEGGQL